MERTRKSKKERVDAILTGDWHLRDTVPVCRTDDFWTAQWKNVDFVSALQEKFDCPVINSGDLFDHWKPSPWLLTHTMLHMPKKFFTIFGNHDLPQHNLDLMNKSGIYTLAEAGFLKILPGCHWGQLPGKEFAWDVAPFVGIEGRSILVWHTMTYQNKTPYPGCTDPKARTLLNKYSDYDLILTGHNHKSFIETFEDSLMVNPGGITRQTADIDDFLYINKPSVYLWNAETNKAKRVFIPVEEDVISRDHIERVLQRTERIDSFVSKLKTDYQSSISFEENLRQLLTVNETDMNIQKIIYKAIDQ